MPSGSSTPSNDAEETSGSYSYSYTTESGRDGHDDARHERTFRISLGRLVARGPGSTFRHEEDGPVAERPNVRCAFYLSTHHTPSPTSSSATSPSDEEDDDEESEHTTRTATRAKKSSGVAMGGADATTTQPSSSSSAAPPETGALTASEKAGEPWHRAESIPSDATNDTDEDWNDAHVHRSHHPWRVEPIVADATAPRDAVTDVDIQISETEDATLFATLQMGVSLNWSFTMTSPNDGASSADVWLVCEIIDEVLDGCALKCAIPFPLLQSEPAPHAQNSHTADATAPAAQLASMRAAALLQSSESQGTTASTRRELFTEDAGGDETEVNDTATATGVGADAAHSSEGLRATTPEWEHIPFVLMFDTGVRSRRSGWYLRCCVEPVQAASTVSDLARRTPKRVVATLRPTPPLRSEETVPTAVATASSAAAVGVVAAAAPVAAVPSPTRPSAVTRPDDDSPAVPLTVVSTLLPHDDTQPVQVQNSNSGAEEVNMSELSDAKSPSAPVSAHVPDLTKASTAVFSADASDDEAQLDEDDPHLLAPSENVTENDDNGRLTPEQTFADEAGVAGSHRAHSLGASLDHVHDHENDHGDDAGDSSGPVMSTRLRGEGVNITQETWSATGSVAAGLQKGLDDGISPMPRKPQTPTSSSSLSASISSSLGAAAAVVEVGKTDKQARGDADADTGNANPARGATAEVPTRAPRLPAATIYLPDEAIGIPSLVAVDGAGPDPELLLPHVMSTTTTITTSGETTMPTRTGAEAAVPGAKSQLSSLAQSPAVAADVEDVQDIFTRTLSTTSSVVSSSSSVVTTDYDDNDPLNTVNSRPSAAVGSGLVSSPRGHDGSDGDATRRSISRSQPFASSVLSSTRHQGQDEGNPEEEEEGAEAGAKRASMKRRSSPGSGPAPHRSSQTQAGHQHQHRRSRHLSLAEALAAHHAGDIVPYESTQARPPPPAGAEKAHPMPPPLSAEEMRDTLRNTNTQRVSHSQLIVSPVRRLSSSEVRAPRGVNQKNNNATTTPTTVTELTATTSRATAATEEVREKAQDANEQADQDTVNADTNAPKTAATAGSALEEVKAPDAEQENKEATEHEDAYEAVTETERNPAPSTPTRATTAARSSLTSGPFVDTDDATGASPTSDAPAGHPLSTSADRFPAPRPRHSASSRGTDGGFDGNAGGVNGGQLTHVLLVGQQSFTSANQFTSSAPVSPKSIASNRRHTGVDEDFLTYNTDPIGQGMHLMHFSRVPADPQRSTADGTVDGGGSPRPPRSPRGVNSGDEKHSSPVDAGVAHGEGTHTPSSYSYTYSDDYSSYTDYSEEEHSSGETDAATAAHREGSHVAAVTGGGGGGSPGRRARHSRRRSRSAAGQTALPQAGASQRAELASSPSPAPPAANMPPDADNSSQPPAVESTALTTSAKRDTKGEKKTSQGLFCCRRRGKQTGKTSSVAKPVPLEVLYQCLTERAEGTSARVSTQAERVDGEAVQATAEAMDAAVSADADAPPRAVPALHAEHICVFRFPHLSRPGATRKGQPDASGAVPSQSEENGVKDALVPSSSLRENTVSLPDSAEARTITSAADGSLGEGGQTALLLAENMRQLINKLNRADPAQRPSVLSADSTLLRSALDERAERAASASAPPQVGAEGSVQEGGATTTVGQHASPSSAHNSTVTEGDEDAQGGVSAVKRTSSSSTDQRPFVRVGPAATAGAAAASDCSDAIRGQEEAVASDTALHTHATDTTLPSLSAAPQSAPSHTPTGTQVMPLPEIANIDAVQKDTYDGATTEHGAACEEDDEETELAIRSKTVGPSLVNVPFDHDEDRDDEDGGEALQPHSEGSTKDVLPLPRLFAELQVDPLPRLQAYVSVDPLPYLYASYTVEPLPFLTAFYCVAPLPYLSAWDAQPPWVRPETGVSLRSIAPPSVRRYFFFVGITGLSRVSGWLAQSGVMPGRTDHDACTQLRVSLLARHRDPLFPASTSSGVPHAHRLATGSVFSLHAHSARRQAAAARDAWSDVLIFSEPALREAMALLVPQIVKRNAPDEHVQPSADTVNAAAWNSANQDDDDDEDAHLDDVEVYVQVERCVVRHVMETCTNMTVPHTDAATPTMLPSNAPEDATAMPPAVPSQTNSTLAISLSNRESSSLNVADSSIQFYSEHSEKAEEEEEEVVVPKKEGEASDGPDVIVSTTSSGDNSALSSSSPPAPLPATKLPDGRCRPPSATASDGSNSAVMDSEEAEREAAEATAQPVDWSYYEVTWEPLTVSPAVGLRALQNAAAAFTHYHRATSSLGQNASSVASDALQSAFALPLRAVRGDRGVPAMGVEGEDVLWSTVSVCHSKAFYEPPQTAHGDKPGTPVETTTALHRAASRLDGLSDAIATYQRSVTSVRCGLSSAHEIGGGDRRVGFETTHSSVFGAASRPLTVLWDTIPGANTGESPREELGEEETQWMGTRAVAPNASSAVTASCCSVVLRCGVVVLEQVAHVTCGAPLPLAALSIASAHEGELVRAEPCAVTAEVATPTFLQQAPVMRYDVSVQTVLTAAANPALLLVVHSAAATTTVFGTASFSPFLASLGGSQDGVDMWLPLYAPASALAEDSGAQHEIEAEAETDTSVANRRHAEGRVRVGWVHCDVACAYASSAPLLLLQEEEEEDEGKKTQQATVRRRRRAASRREPETQIEQCLWKRTDALRRCVPLDLARAAAAQAQSDPQTAMRLVDLTLVAATNVFAPSAGPRKEACNAFCEVEVLKKKTAQQSRRTQKSQEASVVQPGRTDRSRTGDPARAPSQLSVATSSASTAITTTAATPSNIFPMTDTVPHASEPTWQHTFRLGVDGNGVRAVVVRLFSCSDEPTAGSPSQLIGTVTLRTDLLLRLSTTQRAVWLPVLPIETDRGRDRPVQAPRDLVAEDKMCIAALLISVTQLSPLGRPLVAPLTRYGSAAVSSPWLGSALLKTCGLPSRTRPVRVLGDRLTSPDGGEYSKEEEEALLRLGAPLCLTRPLEPSATNAPSPFFVYRDVCVHWPWLAHLLQVHGGAAYLLVEPLLASGTKEDLFLTPSTATDRAAQRFGLAPVGSHADCLRLLHAPHTAATRSRRRLHREQTHEAETFTSVFVPTTSATPSPTSLVFCGEAVMGLRYRVMHGRAGQPTCHDIVLAEGEWHADAGPADVQAGLTPLDRVAAASVDVLLCPLTAQWTPPIAPVTQSGGVGASAQLVMPWTPASKHDGRALTYPQHVEPGVLSFQLEVFPHMSESTPPAVEDTEAAPSTHAIRDACRWTWPDVGVVAALELCVEDWVDVPADCTEGESRGTRGDDDNTARCEWCPMRAARWPALGLSAVELVLSSEDDASDGKPLCVPLASVHTAPQQWTSSRHSALSPAGSHASTVRGIRQDCGDVAKVKKDDDNTDDACAANVLRLEWPARRFPWFSRLPPTLALRWHSKAQETRQETTEDSAALVGATLVPHLASFASQAGRVWLPVRAIRPCTPEKGTLGSHVGFVCVRYRHNFIASESVPKGVPRPLLTLSPALVVVRVEQVRQRPPKSISSDSHLDAPHPRRGQTVPVVVGYEGYSYGLSRKVSLNLLTDGEDTVPQVTSEPIVFPFYPSVEHLPLMQTPLGVLNVNQSMSATPCHAPAPHTTPDQPTLRVQVVFTDPLSHTRTVGFALVPLAARPYDHVWVPLFSEKPAPRPEDDCDAPRRWLGEVQLQWRTLPTPTMNTLSTCPSSCSAPLSDLQLPQTMTMTATLMPMTQGTADATAWSPSLDTREDDVTRARTDTEAPSRTATPPRATSAGVDKNDEAGEETVARQTCQYAVLQSIQWSPAANTAEEEEEGHDGDELWIVCVRAAGSGPTRRNQTKPMMWSAENASAPGDVLEPTVDEVVLQRAAPSASQTVRFTAATASVPATGGPHTDRAKSAFIAPADALLIPFPCRTSCSSALQKQTPRARTATKDEMIPFVVEVLRGTPSTSTTAATWRVVGSSRVEYYHRVLLNTGTQSPPSLRRYSLPLRAKETNDVHSPAMAGLLSFSVVSTTASSPKWFPLAPLPHPEHDRSGNSCKQCVSPLPRPSAALFHILLTDLHLEHTIVTNKKRDDFFGGGASAVRLCVARAGKTGTDSFDMTPTTEAGRLQWAADVCLSPSIDDDDQDQLHARFIMGSARSGNADRTRENCEDGGDYTSCFALSQPWQTGTCVSTEETVLYDPLTGLAVGSASWEWRLLTTSEELYNPRSLFFTRRGELTVMSCAGLVQGDVEALRECAWRYQRLRHLAERRHEQGKRLSQKHRELLAAVRAALDALVVRASMDAVQSARADSATERRDILTAQRQSGFRLSLFTPDPDVRVADMYTRPFRAPTALHVLSHCASLEVPVQETDVPPVVPLPPLPATTAEANTPRPTHEDGLLRATLYAPFTDDDGNQNHSSHSASTATLQLDSCEAPQHPTSATFIEGGGALGRGDWVLEAPSCADPRPTVEHQLVRLHLFSAPQKGLSLLTSAVWQTEVTRGDSVLQCLRVRLPAQVLMCGRRREDTRQANTHRNIPLRMRLSYGFSVHDADVYAVDVPMTMAPLPTTPSHGAAVCEWTTTCMASRVPRVGQFGARLRSVTLFVDTLTDLSPAGGVRDGRSRCPASGEGVLLGCHEWTSEDETALFGDAGVSQGEVLWVECSPTGGAMPEASAAPCALLLSRQPLSAACLPRPTPASKGERRTLRTLQVEEAALTMTGDVGVVSACDCRCSLLAANSSSPSSMMWQRVVSNVPAWSLSRSVAALAEVAERCETLVTDTEGEAPAVAVADTTVHEQKTVQEDVHNESAESRGESDAEDGDRTESDEDESASSDSDESTASASSAPSSGSSDFSAFDGDHDSARDEEAAKKKKAKKDKKVAKTAKAKKVTKQPPKRTGNAMAELQSLLARAASAGTVTPAPTTPAATVNAEPVSPSPSVQPGEVTDSHVCWRALTEAPNTPFSIVPIATPSSRAPSTPQEHQVMVVLRACPHTTASSSSMSNTVYVACGSVEAMMDGLACDRADNTISNGCGTSSWPVYRMTNAPCLDADAQSGGGSEYSAGCSAVWSRLRQAARQTTAPDSHEVTRVGILKLNWRVRTSEVSDVNSTAAPAAVSPPPPFDAEKADDDDGTTTVPDGEDERGRDHIQRLFHPTVPGVEIDVMDLSTLAQEASRGRHSDAVTRRDIDSGNSLPEDRHGPFFSLQRELTAIALAHHEEEEEALEVWLDRLTAVQAAHRAASQAHTQDWDWVVRAVHVEGIELVRFEDETLAASPRFASSSPSRPRPPSRHTTTRCIGDLVVHVTHRHRALSANRESDGQRTHVPSAPPSVMLCELALLDCPQRDDASEETSAAAPLSPLSFNRNAFHGGSPKELSLTATSKKVVRMDTESTPLASATFSDAQCTEREPDWLVGVARAEACATAAKTNAHDSNTHMNTSTPARTACTLFEAHFEPLTWALRPAHVKTLSVRESARIALWQLAEGETESEARATPTVARLGDVALGPLLAQLAAYTQTTTTTTTMHATPDLTVVSAWMPLERAAEVAGQQNSSAQGLRGGGPHLQQHQARVRVCLERVPSATPSSTATITNTAANVLREDQVPAVPSPSSAPAARRETLLTLCAQLDRITVEPRQTSRSAGPQATVPLPPLALLASHMTTQGLGYSAAPSPSGLLFSTHLLPLVETSATAAAAPPHRRPQPTTSACNGLAAPAAPAVAVPVPVPVAVAEAPPSGGSSTSPSVVSAPSSQSGLPAAVQVSSHTRASGRRASTVAGQSMGAESDKARPVAREVDLSESHTHAETEDDDDAAQDLLHPDAAPQQSSFESFSGDDDTDDDDVQRDYNTARAEPASAPVTSPSATIGGGEAVLVPVHSIFCWRQGVPVGQLDDHTARNTRPSPLPPRFYLVRTTRSTDCSDLDEEAKLATQAMSSRLGVVAESQVADVLGSVSVPDVDWAWLLETVATRLSQGEVEPVTLQTDLRLVLTHPDVVITLRLFLFTAPTASLVRAMEWLSEKEALARTQSDHDADAGAAEDITHTTAAMLPQLKVSDAVLATDPATVGPGAAMCTVLIPHRETTTTTTSAAAVPPCFGKVLTLLVGGLGRVAGLERLLRPQEGCVASMRQFAWRRAWASLAREWDVPDSAWTAQPQVRRRDGGEAATAVRPGPLQAAPQRGVLRTIAAAQPSHPPWHVPPPRHGEQTEAAAAWQWSVLAGSGGGMLERMRNRTGHVLCAYQRTVARDDTHERGESEEASPECEWIIVVDGGFAHRPVPCAAERVSSAFSPLSQPQGLAHPASSSSRRTSGRAARLSGAVPRVPASAISTAKGLRRPLLHRTSHALAGSAPPAMSADALQDTRCGLEQTLRVQPLCLAPCASVQWNLLRRRVATIADCLVHDTRSQRATPATPPAGNDSAAAGVMSGADSTSSLTSVLLSHAERVAAGLRSGGEEAPVQARYAHHTGVVVADTLWLLGGWRVVPATSFSQDHPDTLPSRLMTSAMPSSSSSSSSEVSPNGAADGGLVARRRSEVQRAALMATAAPREQDTTTDAEKDAASSPPLFLFDDREDTTALSVAQSTTQATTRHDVMSCHVSLHQDIRTLDLRTCAEGSVPVLVRSLPHKPPSASCRGIGPRDTTTPSWPHLVALDAAPQLACHVAMTSGDWIVLFGGLTPTEVVWEGEEPPLAATDGVFLFHTRRLVWYQHRRDAVRRGGAEFSTGRAHTKSHGGSRRHIRRESTAAEDQQRREAVTARVQQWPLARYGHAVARVPTSRLSTAQLVGACGGVDPVLAQPVDDEAVSTQGEAWTTYIVYGGATTTISTGHQWLVPAEEVLWVCHVHARDALVRWQRVHIPTATTSPLTSRFLPSVQVVPMPDGLAAHCETASNAPSTGTPDPMAGHVMTLTRTVPQRPQQRAGAVLSVADLCGGGGVASKANTHGAAQHFVLIVSGGSAERTVLYSTAAAASASPRAAGSPSLSLDISAPSLSYHSTQPHPQPQKKRTPATTPMKAPAIAVEDRSPCGMYGAFVENWLGGAPLGTVFAHVQLE